MRYKLFGKSGLRVSEICLGTMTFGEEWGWGSSYAQSRKIFDCFADNGGNFIDTANFYTTGTSEKMLGEFLAHHRERFVLATKYTLCMNENDPNAGGNHRKNLFQSVHASLKRLSTDYIDILWVHAWDFMTPVEEVMRGLDDLIRAGKIHYIGISDTPAWIVSQANTLASLKGWSSFIGLQLEYSLVERTIESEFFPLAQAFDLAITAWSPLAAGLLTGKYHNKTEQSTLRLNEAEDWFNRYFNDRNLKIVDTVVEIAKEIGQTPAQVAINWIRQKDITMIPIIGARTFEQLKDNLACLDFTLSQEQILRLNQVSQFLKGFPHEFLKSNQAQQAIFGKMLSQIDNHREQSKI